MQVYLQYIYYITVTKTGGRHPILRPWICSADVRVNVVMRMGTQQQYKNQDWYVNELFYLKHGLYHVKSGVLPKKFGHKSLLSLSAQPNNV